MKRNVVPISVFKRNVSKQDKKKFSFYLQGAFHFEYAGKCEIFIHYVRDKYQLVHQGVHIVGDIFMFSPNYIGRFNFDSLFLAIKAFNLSLQIILESMDWFDPEEFERIKNYYVGE